MKKFLKYGLIIILFIALSFGSGFLYVLKGLNHDDLNNTAISETDEITEKEKRNILLLGLDAGTIGASEKNNRYRSDTMMVVSIDSQSKKINILSIPRDTKVNIPGVGTQKINAAMAYGGPNLAVRTVKNFLGVPIHNYVTVKYKGFRDIIDALGGVELEVERHMDYDDDPGNLHIHLKPGLQVLDGDKAEQFVRYRQYPDADIGRIRAQHKFLNALTKTVLKPGTLLKLPKIIDTIQENVDTDIQPLEMAKLGHLARQIDKDNINMYILPGKWEKISGYYIPYKIQMSEMINEIFFDGTDIKVAVLNGNGASGIATKVAKQLEKKGYKVVEIANADSFDYETTTILYPSQKKNDAEKIASIFTKAELKEENQKKAGFTVIIGKDLN